MVWPLLIMAGASLLQSGQKDNAAALDNKNANKRIAAENDAIMEANLKNGARTAFQAGLLNVQAAQSKTRYISDLAAVRKSALSAAGTEAANAAAAGVVGASVDAAALDVQRLSDEVQNARSVEYEYELVNYETQLADIIAQGQDALRDPSKTVSAPRSTMFNNLLSAGVAVGSKYVGDRSALGLGNKASTPRLSTGVE